MDLFLGTYFYNVDDKKRIRLPSKFKSMLDGDVVVTMTDNHELSVVSYDKFKSQINKMLLSNSTSNRKQRNVIKYLTSRSVEIKVDQSCRILLTQEMIDFSGITKEVVITGWGDRFGITSKENHDLNMKRLELEETVEKGIDSFEELFML